jgi:hypothetical protein
MRIKWGNIFALAILTCLIILLSKLPLILDRLPHTIEIPYYVNDPRYGIIILGLICVTIVAVVKILSDR